MIYRRVFVSFGIVIETLRILQKDGRAKALDQGDSEVTHLAPPLPAQPLPLATLANLPPTAPGDTPCTAITHPPTSLPPTNPASPTAHAALPSPEVPQPPCLEQPDAAPPRAAVKPVGQVTVGRPGLNFQGVPSTKPGTWCRCFMTGNSPRWYPGRCSKSWRSEWFYAGNMWPELEVHSNAAPMPNSCWDKEILTTAEVDSIRPFLNQISSMKDQGLSGR